MGELVVAVDVGGTTIRGALVDRGGAFVRERSRPTPAERGPAVVIAELQGLIGELLACAPVGVSAVGAVVPGVVDAARGRSVLSANLGWRDEPLRDQIAGLTGLPAVLEHDVRAAGLADRTIGATAEVEDSLLAVIGTGIAAVAHVGGASVRGAAGLAGELGHVPVRPGGEPCPCGQRGCLERYASAAAVARRYAQDGGEAGLTARDVVARAGEGDALAARVWAEAVETLALGLATCTMLLDPALIALAGGLSDAREALLEPLRAALAELLTWREPPRLERSPLGGRAGIVGAALLAWQAVGESDFGSWRGRWAAARPPGELV